MVINKVLGLRMRLPRVLLAALVGAELGAAGAAMQGLIRDPLADPGPIGVSARAALAAVAAIVLGGSVFGAAAGPLGLWLRPAAAFAGGIGATPLMARLGSVGGVRIVSTLPIAGMAVNALAGALTGLLIVVADDRQVRDMTFWTLGSLPGARWARVPVAPLLIGAPALLLCALARPLGVSPLGEAEAFHLGARRSGRARGRGPVRHRGGGRVAFAGLIGFVGSVAPQLVRLVLPGAALLVLADPAARGLAAPAGLPEGVVTALIGAPFFLWLLRRSPPAGDGP